MSSENSENSGKRELIAFRIGEQDYGVDITTVREIRGFSSATPLPRSPSYVRGVINLRGTVLPIIDLAERLGFDPIRSSRPTAPWWSSSRSDRSSTVCWSTRSPTS